MEAGFVLMAVAMSMAPAMLVTLVLAMIMLVKVLMPVSMFVTVLGRVFVSATVLMVMFVAMTMFMIVSLFMFMFVLVLHFFAILQLDPTDLPGPVGRTQDFYSIFAHQNYPISHVRFKLIRNCLEHRARSMASCSDSTPKYRLAKSIFFDQAAYDLHWSLP
jgi:hypothetical protein